MSKNRLLTDWREIGPYRLSASYAYNQESGEWDILDSLNIDHRGKTGTDNDRHLDAIGRWFSRCVQGRELVK